MRLTRHRRSDLIAAAVLVAVVTVQWLVLVGFFEGQSLKDPLLYSGDGFFTGAAVAAGMRGEYYPFLSKEFASLGAPFVASWNDFPGADDWLFFVVGLMARAFGVFGAINVSLLLASLFAALAMFVVARRFHLNRPFAVMAGVLFGLSGYIMVRGTMHFSLTMYWIIPFQILSASWLASRKGIAFRSKKFAFTLLVGLVTGWSFLYYSFFAAQIYSLALLVRMFRGKRLQPLLVGLALAVVTALSIFSMTADTLFYMNANGVNRAATYRAATDVEMYALKPISMLVPGPNHKFKFARIISSRSADQTMVQGETPAPYLGMVPNAMMLGLVAAAAMAIARRKMHLGVTWAFTVAWFIIGHSVGGQNSLMGLMGMRLLRSVNRVSIVILAFVLLFGAWALPRLMRGVGPWGQWVAALALAIFGAYEVAPKSATPEVVAQIHRMVESDRALVTQAEAVLPAGSAVFELPVMEFPEVPPYQGVDGYELFRPYFYAKHLRFSHGDVKGRPNASWKFQVASLPPPQMLAELRSKGFSSLYLNLKGFPGQEQLVIDSFIGAGARVLAKAELGDSIFLAL